MRSRLMSKDGGKSAVIELVRRDWDKGGKRDRKSD
jgi:hypothetical protein